ncbi:hypothetical protein Bca4012_028594 [Brassica carinata]|uniref:BnaC04g02570D protein n=2 Tax=Brassica napus TaxID=3708 RepID=A0A078IVQ0_BRANA|nr:hypothetical protein HID58_058191 [Brassica napus]CAF1802118.1 unnamed protein product [Brassica napus]CDY53499.1 BnaC04g02570D [Brassica napus]
MLDQSGEVFIQYISVVFDFVCAESSYCQSQTLSVAFSYLRVIFDFVCAESSYCRSQILSVAFSCLRYVFGGIPIRPAGNGLPLGKPSKFSKKLACCFP